MAKPSKMVLSHFLLNFLKITMYPENLILNRLQILIFKACLCQRNQRKGKYGIKRKIIENETMGFYFLFNSNKSVCAHMESKGKYFPLKFHLYGWERE